jgi:hypothetical protein
MLTKKRAKRLGARARLLLLFVDKNTAAYSSAASYVVDCIYKYLKPTESTAASAMRNVRLQ